MKRYSICICLLTSMLFASAGCATERETIAVLGTGDMGDSFGPRLASLGYPVVYGSRNADSDKVVALVEKTGRGASAAGNDVAARHADIIFLALPWVAIEALGKNLGDLEGKIIIDLSWPDSGFAEDGYVEMRVRPSGAEVIQGWFPKSMVVKAFGTTGSNVIDNPNDAGGPVTIPIASDYRQAKEVTARIAAELGMDPVDAGPLRMSRNIEAMMELYLVPHTQGRDVGWEFYFRRTNYWQCNRYTGGEEVESDIPAMDAGNLADIPDMHGPAKACE